MLLTTLNRFYLPISYSDAPSQAKKSRQQLHTTGVKKGWTPPTPSPAAQVGRKPNQPFVTPASAKKSITTAPDAVQNDSLLNELSEGQTDILHSESEELPAPKVSRSVTTRSTKMVRV